MPDKGTGKLRRLVERARRIEEYLRKPEAEQVMGDALMADVALSLAFLAGTVWARCDSDQKVLLGAAVAGYETWRTTQKDAAERLGAAFATGDREEIEKAAQLYAMSLTGVPDVEVILMGVDKQKSIDPKTKAKVDAALAEILRAADDENGKES